MRVRRVVTGHDASGKAVVTSDEEVEPVTAALLPGGEFHRLWGGDSTPTFPDDGSPTPQKSYYPPVGGYRFAMFRVTPGARTLPPDLDLEAARAELDEKLPGLSGRMDPDVPGRHASDTVDFGIVLAGEVILHLDDGAETVLRTGDTFVQNGTFHRWSNNGTEPAVVCLFMAGARREENR
ncbi:cupin domain-containing protein [Nocardia nova]|uniref:cupin domain-containing protein n=1 Tax=Nocardia nova TaxID=37330 RepID=UPI00046D67E6|nr:cupin domain-containing protein [Nocardia nova]